MRHVRNQNLSFCRLRGEKKTGNNGAVEYYNLAGQRIPRSTHGIVIVRKGNSVKKMMVR